MSVFRKRIVAGSDGRLSWASPGGTKKPVSEKWDWTEDSPPWAYPEDLSLEERHALFTADWDADVEIIPLNNSLGSTFWDRLYNTVNAHGGRPVVYIPEGVYQLTKFKRIPYDNSGTWNYAVGFWHPRLRGLLGDGADKTIIEMAPNSMAPEQLADLETRSSTTYQVSEIRCFRIDSNKGTSRVHISGVGFRAHDQQPIKAVASDIAAKGVKVPTPAPHSGMSIFVGDTATWKPTPAIVSYCGFWGFARALLSQPPFEHTNISSQFGDILMHHVESDGRRHKDIDPTQPRRCGTIMANNEIKHELRDFWFHHNMLSRYAVNDQNYNTSGHYQGIRLKGNDISNFIVGGSTNPTLMGWETTSAKITLDDVYLTIDNDSMAGATQQHLGFTLVPGGKERVLPAEVGPLIVNGGRFRNKAWPQLDGMLSIRLKPEDQAGGSPWYYRRDELIFVYDENGVRKKAWEYTGVWPPTATQMAAAGVSASTHYLVRPTNV